MKIAKGGAQAPYQNPMRSDSQLTGKDQPPDRGDPGPSVRSLLQRTREGDAEAATLLYYKYAAPLWLLARAYCIRSGVTVAIPEEMVRGAFHRYLGSPRPEDYDVPDRGELWRLCLVVVLQPLLALAPADPGPEQELSPPPSSTPPSLDFLPEVAREALVGLPKRLAEVAELCLAGYELGQIAAKMGRSLRTVERLLQECRTRLEASFDEWNETTG